MFEILTNKHKAEVGKMNRDVREFFGGMHKVKEMMPKLYVDLKKLEQECADIPFLKEQFDTMLKDIYSYVEDVCSFSEAKIKKHAGDEESISTYQNADETRRIIHDAMIASVNVLGRAMEKFDKDNTWWKNNFNSSNRAGYARFALMTAYLKLMENET